MSSAITTSVLILPFEPYQLKTPTVTVLGANPTATTYEIGCGGNETVCSSLGWTNTLIVGPWAGKTVPAGSPATGTFHWMLDATLDAGGPLYTSVECIVSKGTPQVCTAFISGGEDGVTATATGFKSITEQLEISFSSLPIIITAGQQLLDPATETMTTEDATSESTVESTAIESSVSGSSTSEATATATATDASNSGLGSLPICVLSAITMAVFALLVIQV
ncbi:hypothetical protein F66182_4866 [Fusarium sp. NRRL 66182]|nr:hypothetical protein F66182_4866 [Fusarium sp. NRRL 66182]